MTQVENSVVTAEKLVKRFEEFTAVNGIDFAVKPGECFGLLGPNGAGKTSTVRMIYGFSPVTAGKLEVFQQDIMKQARQIKARIGVVPQEDNLDPDLTVRENLLTYASYFRLAKPMAVERADEILEFMDLQDKANEVVEHLSGGLKRRLTLGRALINQPELLILDEPTTGLDPYARHLVWQRLRRLKQKGTTMLLTTHYLDEASQLCDRLIIIYRGEILEQGSPTDLIERHVGKEALELGVEPDQREALSQVNPALVKARQSLGDDLVLFTEKGQDLNQQIGKWAVDHGLNLTYRRLRPANLEDVFLKLTGETLEAKQSEAALGGEW